MPQPYRNISIVLGVIIVALFFVALALPYDQRAGVGIVSRFVLAGFTFVNAVWVWRERRSVLGTGLLLLVGVGLVVTAIMGYGFNGRPPMPWLIR